MGHCMGVGMVEGGRCDYVYIKPVFMGWVKISEFSVVSAYGRLPYSSCIQLFTLYIKIYRFERLFSC